jgi:hypothetical protein
MEELTIYKFQLEQLKDTLRMVANVLGSRAKISSLDRDIMASTEMVNNAFESNIDVHVTR